MWSRSPYLLLLSCLIAGELAAQEVTPVEFHKSSIKAYPYVYYTPETQLAFGVGGIMTFYAGRDTSLRPSSVSLSGYYTSNDQWKIGVVPKVFYSGNERYASLPASFGHYQSKFWGIGNDTPDISDAAYLEDVADVRFELQWPPLLPIFDRSGAIYHFASNKILDVGSNPNLQQGDSLETEGGILSGVGLTFVADSRNETFYPTGGRFYTISAIFYPELLGSDFEFTHLTLDFRHFLPAWGKWGAVAIQAYGEFVIGSPPFYKYPALGGSNRMRGYFYGRFRDKAYVTAQVEYRRHIWRKIGGILFLGLGQVGPAIADYELASFHVSSGFGLRYLFNAEEHVNIRVDFGFGGDDATTGVYFGVEEAF
jgi:hypothetical protein